VFRPSIYLPAETVGFHQYGQCAAGTIGIISGTKQGVIYIDLLTNTVYTSRIGRYGTELTSLIFANPLYNNWY